MGLYFSASWCPPCKGFTPVLSEWYTKMKEARDDLEIIFVSSDRSEAEFKAYAAKMPWLSLDYERRDLKGALGQAFNVTGIPTLVFLDKDGSVLTLEGRKKVMTEPEQFPWKGDKKAKTVKGAAGGYDEISEAIDIKNTVCLNTDPDSSPLSSVFQEGGSLISDADEQLLLNITFHNVVKIHSFKLIGEGDEAPKNVRLFINQVSMGFDNVEDLKPVQTFELSKEAATDESKEPILVNFVQYQKVSQLSIFVESNQGDGDRTVVKKVQIYGVKTDIGSLH